MIEWASKNLSEIAKISYGHTASANFDSIGPKFLRITDIQNDRVDWDSVPYCTVDAKSLIKHRLVDGDIVFARTGATTGKSYLVVDPPESVFASYLIRVQLDNGLVTPEFLYKYFQTSDYWDSIAAGSSGSAQGGFNASKLGKLTIPLPPLPEQQRIVAILDEAFASIASAVETAELNLTNASELFQNHLKQMFSGGRGGWADVRLGDACTLQRGFDLPKRLRQPGEFPLISSSGKIDSHCEAKVKGPGVVTGRSGSIGSVFFVEQDFWPLNTTLYVKDFHGNNAEFIFRLLQSFDLSRFTTGAGVPTLNRNNVHSETVKITKDLDEQARLIRELDELSSDCNALQTVYRNKIKSLAELKQSVLQKAFSGDLTAESDKALAETGL